jgi:SAM-dependent methyltransferase
MREALFNAEGVKTFTPNEPWIETRDKKGHWYNAQADYALKHLKDGGKCLVIGSPIFEALELEESGLDVTYLDVRKAPFTKFILDDATSIPLPDESFDCISSTCVLCHAGLGRYGDPHVEDGDEKMLAEIARVLKKGGKAALTFGPVSSAVDDVLNIDNCHRVYTLHEAYRMLEVVGLKVLDVGVFSLITASWFPNVPYSPLLDAYYLSMCVEK